MVEPRRRHRCAGCHRGPLPRLVVEDGAPLCLDCAALGDLVCPPRGDAALTRRAREASGRWAVVVRRNRRRNRYERQGAFVEPAAPARAEPSCRADAGARAERRARDVARRAAADGRFRAELTVRIMRLFPGCPPTRAAGIAAHTGERGSGRVGRTAAGRALDEGAVTAAVRASVRHLDTEYDALPARGLPRHQARTRVAPAIETGLDSWRR
ncbi:DUF2293 domain-containing protein [Streptomyces lichenis]|uniref:DUF2293 domain-containing protein n=1 Tax=Streptomyces lichenis TaxID=2306967 RepID=A0ABT0ICL9_9ACTN|nr:DUF2293 domain-containing protein [Streptomyces lichenis]MCK8679073.1 DUF2293 domain-containing protein [Streptomyces lichenis]